jgi:hypothetical protein
MQGATKAKFLVLTAPGGRVRRAVWYKFTDISEALIAPIIRKYRKTAFFAEFADYFNGHGLFSLRHVLNS